MGNARHALIVAASKYRDARLPPLGAPGQDARHLRDVLRNAEIGGFDVQLALNYRVQALRRTLESFFAKRALDDLLLIHFSGHGLKDDEGQLYLAAADTEVDLLRATALDTEWLRQLMNDCRSEKIAVFLDCCFGGAFATAMTHKVGVDVPGVMEHLGGAGRVVITASNAVQYAFEGGSLVGTPEASVFTQALVTGLHTGEADRNEDGKVTINELFEYLRDKVHEKSPNQTPMKWEFKAEGDWEIANSRRASIKLLAPDLQARMTSTDTVLRLAAVSELGGLLESPDVRMRESAELALRGLTADDSDKVRAAANRVLALPRSAAVIAPSPAPGIDDQPGIADDDGSANAPPMSTDLVDDGPAPATDDVTAIAAREAEERRKKIAIGIGAGVVGVGLLAAIAWVGCVGRECGPSASPSSGSSANASTGPVDSPNGSIPAGSGGAVVVAPPGTLVYSVLVNDLPGTSADDYDIWTAASDGSSERPIVTAPGRQTDPAWSPDGSEIAYADATSGIRLVTANGESVARFTNVTADLNPIWAADGTIAFTRSTSKGNLDLYILGRNDPGSGPTQLTTAAESDWDPSWSPAGDRIAFASDRVSPKAIFTMDADGAHQLQLTFDGGYYDDPAWSPRGDWIAATRAAEKGGTKSIWLIPVAGGDPHRLTQSGASESDPTWSDDGRELAFTRAGELVIVDLDGNTLRSFASSGGRIVWPEWH